MTYLRSGLVAALAWPLFGAPLAAAPASFDCTKARNDVERAICADAGLSAKDVEIAGAIATLLRRLDLVTAKVLREDQIAFQHERDAVAGGAGALAARLDGRAAFLASVDPAPRQGFAGTWANSIGRVEVVAEGKGLRAAVRIADPNGGWTCTLEGAGEPAKAGLAFPAAEPGWTVRLARKSAALTVAIEPPKGTRPATPYPGCQRWGTVPAGFLPVR